MKLEGKVAVITGADSGIGRASAEAFAREGADVAITYHTDRDGGDETRRRVEAAGRRAWVIQTDVSDPASVQALFDGAGAGRAGGERGRGHVRDARGRDGGRGVRGCARAFIRARKAAGNGGRIVFVGSVAGHLPTAGSAPCGMAKAGVNSLVRSLSRELSDMRINVDAIAPGLIATPMTQARLDDPEKRGKSLEAIPWGRPGPAGGDRRPGRVPGFRRRGLRHGADLGHGRRAHHELGRGLSSAFCGDPPSSKPVPP